ncbi:unnamed protein product, partial [marine sediment metagenome]
DKLKFRNLRAEMWWNTGRRFAEKDIKLTKKEGIEYEKLKRELSSVSYLIREGKM